MYTSPAMRLFINIDGLIPPQKYSLVAVAAGMMLTSPLAPAADANGNVPFYNAVDSITGGVTYS